MVKINNIICLLAVSLVAAMPAESSNNNDELDVTNLNKRGFLDSIFDSSRIFGKDVRRWGCCDYDCSQEKWPASGACMKARYSIQRGRKPIDMCHKCHF